MKHSKKIEALPQWLGQGKSLGVLALSSPAERTRLERGLSELELQKVSYKVALDPSAAYGSDTHLFSSASASDRVRALYELAQDPTVGAIMAVRGGGGALELLPLLDWKLLAAHPKPLVGFSDTTALLVALHERAGWPCIHGPAVESTFAKAAQSPAHRVSAQQALKLLRGEGETLRGYKVTCLLGSGSATSTVLGGNLSILSSLAGTPWQPSFQDKILLLEEIDEKPFRIHRMLLQMRYAGMLSGVRAVLLGSFTGCTHPESKGPDLLRVIKEIFEPTKVPVFGWVSSGHCPDNIAVPFYSTVTLDSAADAIV